MRLSERLKPIISDLLTRNKVTKSRLRGGAFCVSIECPPNGEPWVQVKSGVLNVYYPSDADPLGKLPSLVGLPRDTACPDWEPWKYATLEFPPLDAAATAELIAQLFVAFYNCPADTEVTTEIFEME